MRNTDGMPPRRDLLGDVFDSKERVGDLLCFYGNSETNVKARNYRSRVTGWKVSEGAWEPAESSVDGWRASRIEIPSVFELRVSIRTAAIPSRSVSVHDQFGKDIDDDISY